MRAGKVKWYCNIMIYYVIYTRYTYTWLYLYLRPYNRITYHNTYKYIHCCNLLAQRMIYRGVTCHLSVQKQQYGLMVVQGMFQFFLNSITMAIMGHCRGSFAQSSIIWLFIHVDLYPGCWRQVARVAVSGIWSDGRPQEPNDDQPLKGHETWESWETCIISA